jgi:hypothetical protein
LPSKSTKNIKRKHKNGFVTSILFVNEVSIFQEITNSERYCIVSIDLVRKNLSVNCLKFIAHQRMILLDTKNFCSFPAIIVLMRLHYLVAQWFLPQGHFFKNILKLSINISRKEQTITLTIILGCGWFKYIYYAQIIHTKNMKFVVAN